MKRYPDSPTIPTRPRILETAIEYPPRSINGDLNRLHFITGDTAPCGSVGMLTTLDGNFSGPNGNKRSSLPPELDHDTAETATPSDVMLSHCSKLPLPDEDEDDDDSLSRIRMPPCPRRTPPMADRWSRMAVKHGLNRKGLLLLLLLGGLCCLQLVALLVMGIFWPKDPNEGERKLCLSPDCLRASAELQGSLNEDVEPCNDFWSYSCGGWLLDNPLPSARSHWSVTTKLKHQALSEMRAMLDTMDEPEDVNGIAFKLRNFYASCMNSREYLKDNLQTIRRIIDNDLHGWNLMRDTWDIRRWDFHYVFFKLHVEFGVSPFFRVEIVPDPLSEGKNIIKLLPSGFAMPHKSYYSRLPNNDVEQAYKQYIKDTVKMFDASGPDALDFASHLYHYESRIAEITPDDEILNDPVLSNTRITIGRLSLISNSIQWLSLLRQMFPNSKLDHRTEILVATEEYFSNLATLMSTTKISAMNSYLMFTLVSAYTPYLSAQNKRVFDLFQNEFRGASEPVERWEFCIETTAKYFGYGLGSLYERAPARQKAREKNIEQIQDMFYQIRNTLRINLANSKWYPRETKSLLSSKLENMSIEIGYPDKLLDPTVIDHFYKDYSIFINNFFRNLRQSIRKSREQLERRLLDPSSELPWMPMLNNNDVTYVYQSNRIVIPPHLLNAPIFHRNYPSCIIYGSLGVRVARQMLRAFDSVGLSYDSRGQLIPRSAYINRTLNHINKLSDCISSTTMSLNVEEDKVVTRTAYDTAAEVDAVRQTYQAYLSLMKREPQYHPPSFETLNTTNIFFMAFAGSLCSEVTKQQEDIYKVCGPSLMEHPRLLAVLSQLPEFTQVFGCVKHTVHYPQKICDSLH